MAEDAMTYSVRKRVRRARAKARFLILSSQLWVARKNGWRDEDAESLGAILAASLENTAYRAYVRRKQIELASLSK